MMRLDRPLSASPWLVLLVLLPLLGVLPAVPVDETRYLSVAWEMRQSGELVALHLNGAAYLDKPPLLFWLINLSWGVLGVSVWAARLVSALAALGSVALVVAIERRLTVAEAPLPIAAWLLTGAIYFALFASVLMFDLLLGLFVLLAMYALVRHLQDGPRWALPMLFGAAALGMLAKGPVLLLHMAGPLLLARWWMPPAAPRRSLGWPLALLMLATLPVLLWALAATGHLQVADVHNLLVRQTAGRMVDSFAHQRKPWWYLGFLPLILLPWPLLVRWREIPQAWRQAKTSPLARFGLAASLPALIGFSAISGKQLHYLLPLFPGAALLLAALLRAQPSLLAHRRLWVLQGAALLAPVWVLHQHWPLLDGTDMRRWLPVALLAVALGVLLAAGLRRSHALRHIALGLGALGVGLAPVVLHGAGGEVAGWLLLALGLQLASLGVSLGVQRLCSLACAVVLLTASALPLLRLSIIGTMDLAPLATRVVALQAQGVAVARVGDEPGLLTFLARLREPLPTAVDVDVWAAEHPQGYLLVWRSHGASPPGLQGRVPIDNGWVGLLPAGEVSALSLR